MIRNPYPFRYLTDWAYDMILGKDPHVPVAKPSTTDPDSPEDGTILREPKQTD